MDSVATCLTSASDCCQSPIEWYVYSPYGELIVHQSTGYGDRDGDGTVDSTDKGTPGSTCTTMSGSCRILDLDFDGDYDSADATLFDSLPSGLQRNPGKLASGVSQPFAHQGLLFEPEIGSYQNRARQYDPGNRRFTRRDPNGFEDGLDLFTYVRANPIRYKDARGKAVSSISITPSSITVRMKVVIWSGRAFEIWRQNGRPIWLNARNQLSTWWNRPYRLRNGFGSFKRVSFAFEVSAWSDDGGTCDTYPGIGDDIGPSYCHDQAIWHTGKDFSMWIRPDGDYSPSDPCGRAVVFGTRSTIWGDESCVEPSAGTFAHELGHNMGLGHGSGIMAPIGPVPPANCGNIAWVLNLNSGQLPFWNCNCPSRGSVGLAQNNMEHEVDAW